MLHWFFSIEGGGDLFGASLLKSVTFSFRHGRELSIGAYAQWGANNPKCQVDGKLPASIRFCFWWNTTIMINGFCCGVFTFIENWPRYFTDCGNFELRIFRLPTVSRRMWCFMNGTSWSCWAIMIIVTYSAWSIHTLTAFCNRRKLQGHLSSPRMASWTSCTTATSMAKTFCHSSREIFFVHILYVYRQVKANSPTKKYLEDFAIKNR